VYLSREQSLQALRNMKRFNNRLRLLFSNFDMNLEADLGRRNILLSGAQEKFFAGALQSDFPETRNDGHTGEPDIIIPELEKELECKLTTRYQSSGAISFQTDSMSFEGKPDGLDFLYVVADKMFESFAVLHFSNLNRDDFHEESPGARGRVRMKKHCGMKKCNVLVGSVEDRKEAYIRRYQLELGATDTQRLKRIAELQCRMASETPYKAKKTRSTIARENLRFLKKTARLESKIRAWTKKSGSYTVNLEKIGDEECQSLTCAA